MKVEHAVKGMRGNVTEAFIVAFIFAVGLAVGSFLGAVSYRVPRGVSVVHPPSACPSCGARLTVIDLVPVFSHLTASGRCRRCGAAVPWRYTVIELLTALGFVVAYVLARGTSPLGSTVDWSQFTVAAVFYSILLVMTVIDLEHMLLPDKLNLVGAAAGFGFSLAGMSGVTPWQALYGALLGYALIFLIVLLSRGGMGMGDAKFLAMIGTFVGPLGVLYTLFGASALGAVVGGGLILFGRHGRKQPLPFGPFLAAAALGVWSYFLHGM